MSMLRAEGMAIDVPFGWEADIRAPRRLAALRETEAATEGTEPTVLHLGNFQLPAERADYGGALLADLGPADVFVSIIDFGPVTPADRLFSHAGIPLPLHARDFSPHAMTRGLPGRSAVQRFFRIGGRGYCLYVVAGSHLDRADLLATVNTTLATFSVTG